MQDHQGKEIPGVGSVGRTMLNNGLNNGWLTNTNGLVEH